jgi:hypothetical protein
MSTPTWTSLGEAAINSMPTWQKLFASAEMELAFTLKLASVKASGWSLGKTEQECHSEAARRLREGE